MEKEQISFENRSPNFKRIFLIDKKEVFAEFKNKLLHVLNQAHTQFLLGVFLWQTEKINESGVLK